MGWLVNASVLVVVAILVGWLAASLLWRLSFWGVHPAEVLNQEGGLRIGSKAPELACYSLSGADMHLSFFSRPTLVVFGQPDCEPCEDLLRVASFHPATRPLRRVFVSASDSVPVLQKLDGRWEAYTFHNESSARDMWRAPVSPYFHLIDAEGRVAAKGIASKPMHLDRLLLLAPDAIRPGTMSTLDIPTPLGSGA